MLWVNCKVDSVKSYLYVIFSDLFFLLFEDDGRKRRCLQSVRFRSNNQFACLRRPFLWRGLGGRLFGFGRSNGSIPFLICIPAKSGAGIGRIPVRFAFGIRQTPPASLSAFVRISPGRFGRVRTGRTARLGIIYKHLFSWQDCFMVRKREEVCLSYSDTTSSGKIVDY